MKKIYLILGAMAVMAGASAQWVNAPKALKERSRANESGVTLHNVNLAERATFYTNDFSTCSDWAMSNAGDEGLSQFVDDLDFECTTNGPSGPAAIADIASTTASNGFMMVDSDLYGGEEGGAGVENCWFQSAQPIDCSAHPFVSLRFQTFYRMWDNGTSDGNEYCLVEVSRDGVTWPDAATFEVSEGEVDFGDGDGDVQARWELFPEMQTQDPVTNPTVMVFDITSAAGGQDEIWLRFRWKGTWGYAWMVDDVELFDTPNDDLAVSGYATYTDYVDTGEFEYGAYPVSQVRPLQFAARAANVGVNGQTNVNLEVEVNGTDAGATSNVIMIPYGASDTLRATGYTPPASLGNYLVEMNVAFDATDENPDDNVATKSFEVTDFSFGRDDKTYTGQIPAATFTGGFMAANLYLMQEDATIYAIDVAFRAGTEDAEIIAHLYDSQSETFEIIGSSEELALNPDFLNAGTNGQVNWYTFQLIQPYDAVAGELLMCGVESFGGAGVRVGESKYAPDQTAFIYGDFGTAGVDWYFTNEIPMVRLNLNEDAENTPDNISESALDLFNLKQNMPNPANQTTRIDYTLKTAGKVTFEVRDITGRIIFSDDMGTQSAGRQNIVLNVSGFAQGVYTYTLNVDGVRETKSMSVK